MTGSLSLLGKRRFLPLFTTQLLGAFNDNLFKNAMVLFVVYNILDNERDETLFSGVASLIFILPFFLLSAMAGQLADTRDKALIIRIVKFCEILIMIVGGAGLLLAWQGIAVQLVAIPLLLLALFAMGVHSTFFGPIKYAILPQHLPSDEVLAGTGWVEAGTYIAILAGTIIAGVIPVEVAAGSVVITAVVGYMTARHVPPAPPEADADAAPDWHIIRASIRLISATMHIRRLYLAIVSISFFWTIGAVLFIQFPPLVKNVLTSDAGVASLFLAIFSVGIAIGSVAVNRLLKGEVSARYSPVSVIVMGLFVVAFYFVCRGWINDNPGELYNIGEFLKHQNSWAIVLTLLGVAISGGMFVVPLYAFLTTTVPLSHTARTVAANNIVNAGAMVVGSIIAIGLSALGMTVINQLLLSAFMCLISAWLAWELHKACAEAVVSIETPSA
jgi:MFS family permease